VDNFVDRSATAAQPEARQLRNPKHDGSATRSATAAQPEARQLRNPKHDGSATRTATAAQPGARQGNPPIKRASTSGQGCRSVKGSIRSAAGVTLIARHDREARMINTTGNQ
jgi:hypothetical protein